MGGVVPSPLLLRLRFTFMLVLVVWVGSMPVAIGQGGFAFDTYDHAPRAHCVVQLAPASLSIAGTNANGTASEYNVEEEAAALAAMEVLPECEPLVCAGAALTGLSNAIARTLPAGVTDPVVCRVPPGAEERKRTSATYAEMTNGECQCTFPKWRLQDMRDEAASRCATIVGDSTSRRMYATFAHILRAPRTNVQRMETQLQQSRWKVFEPLNAKSNANNLHKWVHWLGGMSHKTNDRFSTKESCLAKCSKSGLILRGWGLHVLHLPPARRHLLLRNVHMYPALVRAIMLQALHIAEQASCDTYVAWKTTNAICDRQNREFQNHYTDALHGFTTLRRHLNISTPLDFNNGTVAELIRLARTENKTTVAQHTAAEVVPYLPIGGAGALLGSFDEFGTRFLNSLASNALRRVDEYLLRNETNGTFLDFATPEDLVIFPHVHIPSGPPASGSRVASSPQAKIGKGKEKGKGKGKAPGNWDHEPLLSADELANVVHSVLRSASPTDKPRARVHMLPALDNFNASLKFCAHTPNDARHYSGLQFLEVRASYHVMMAIEQHRLATETPQETRYMH